MMSLSGPTTDARRGRDESRVGGVELPAAGGGPAAFNSVKIKNSGENAGPIWLLLQCSGGMCRGSWFSSYTAENTITLRLK
jgi:hypothetical protein